MNANNIILKLKGRGQRITTARKNIINIIVQSSDPISINEINTVLIENCASVNKTTVYREIEFLLKEKVIREIDFGQGMKRYELIKANDHHHHLVCLNCKKSEHISFKEEIIVEQEIALVQQIDFKISYHSLEFYGLCRNCKS